MCGLARFLRCHMPVSLTGHALRAVLALCLSVLVSALPAPAAAETLQGVVIAVIDGDTVLFRPDASSPSRRAFMKIRLADIDAPEHDQPYGDAATRALAAMVLERRVAVDTVATDVYGRTIGHIRVGAGEAVGLDLVRRGLAWPAARSRRAAAARALQHEARHERRGLWRDAAPVPPWVWRRTHPPEARPADRSTVPRASGAPRRSSEEY